MPTAYLRCLFSVVAIAAVAAFPNLAFAQSNTSRTVRLTVGYTAGGPVDAMARIMAEALAPRLQQTVLVENNPGANGVTALERLAQTAPDGLTMNFMSVSALVAMYFQNKPLDFDRTATAIAGTFESALIVVVNPSMIPAKSFRELIAYLKANPGTVYASAAGIGSQGHLFMEAVAKAEGLKMTFVPYPGAARAMQDVLGGTVGLMIADMTTTEPHIASGKIVPLGVTSPKRWPTFPNVPTIVEQGFAGQEATTLGGLIGPPNMPKELVAKLSGTVKEVLADPAVQKRIRAAGYEPSYFTPDEFRARLASIYDRWGKVIAETGIKP